MILINHGEEDVTIRRGDRIAQLVIAPVIRARWTEVEALDETPRGAGGFGSTGAGNRGSSRPPGSTPGSQPQHVFHPVEAGRAPRDPGRRANGAQGEEPAVAGRVGQGEDLVLGGEDHGVLADDAAAAQDAEKPIAPSRRAAPTPWRAGAVTSPRTSPRPFAAAPASSRAVPDGASSLRRWWASVTSMSQASGPRCAAACSTRAASTVIPIEKLPDLTMAITRAASAIAASSPEEKPVDPITRAGPPPAARVARSAEAAADEKSMMTSQARSASSTAPTASPPAPGRPKRPPTAKPSRASITQVTARPMRPRAPATPIFKPGSTPAPASMENPIRPPIALAKDRAFKSAATDALQETAMKLYSVDLSPYATRVRMAIHAKGLDIEIAPPPGGDLKSAEYLAVNPMGKVPPWCSTTVR